MSFQFHYTPPPDEVIRTGQLATCALYAALLAVPKVWLGTLIGSLGSAIITYQVVSQAKGEAALLSMLIEVPAWTVIGAVVGGLAPLVGKRALHLLRRNSKLPVALDRQGENKLPK